LLRSRRSADLGGQNCYDEPVSGDSLAAASVIMENKAKQVLCVEDNPVNMLLVSRIVEAEGHELIKAEDGPTALSLLETVVPDIILLDINLPGIDGLELARRFKADERLAPVPLIATTAQVLVGDRERCLEAGCDDYLPKPLDIRKLREVMRTYLNK
jgi:two-component system, cell cycle response regulator DivK